MHIKFNSIFYQNFLSTGSAGNILEFDKYPTTLITGRNGSGKSTFIDALTFVLFNKSHRDINLTALPNSVNTKKMVVEVKFTIGTNKYLVRRGAKPSVFEIIKNDELIPQDAANGDYQNYLETQILGLDFKTFCQLVVIGKSSYTPFMKLSPAVRRDRIESFLDIQIFSTMAELIKEQVTSSKQAIIGIEAEYSIHKNKIDVQNSYIQSLSNDHKAKTEETQLQIQSIFTKIAELEKEIIVHQNAVNSLSKTITDSAFIKEKNSKLSDLKYKLDINKKSLITELSFFDNNDDCPTCKQHINDEFKSEIITQKSDKNDELSAALLSLESQISTVSERVREIENTNSSISDLNYQIRDLQGTITSEQRYLQKLQKELMDATYDGSNLDMEKDKLRGLAVSALSIANKKNELQVDRQYIDMCVNLLKDKTIKAEVVAQYLPIINSCIDSYLERLDFFVGFELDTAFNEIILSRDRDSFSYNSFSQGEQSRIDLALLFTWIKICGLKNTVSCNICVFDETLDGSLDSDTSALVLDIIKDDLSDKNVIVVSHYPHLYDSLTNTIKFEKIGNYSSILV